MMTPAFANPSKIISLENTIAEVQPESPGLVPFKIKTSYLKLISTKIPMNALQPTVIETQTINHTKSRRKKAPVAIKPTKKRKRGSDPKKQSKKRRLGKAQVEVDAEEEEEEESVKPLKKKEESSEDSSDSLADSNKDKKAEKDTNLTRSFNLRKRGLLPLNFYTND